MARGVLAVISGFSGVGKGTLVKALLEKYDNYELSVSATTRKPRPGERDGVDYFFLTKEEFEKKISEGKFLEYTRYLDNYYGTPREFVEKKLREGRDIILEIEMEGGLNVKKVLPEARLIFVVPPDMDTLIRRLTGRGTETKEQIGARLARAEEEKAYIGKYEHILVNDDFDKALDELNEIIQKQEG